MAITCGFYNSLDHDRKYDAREFGQLFDGIIRDGIFMSIGTCFMATADGEDMGVIIGAGHAWFNQSWTNNDSPMALYLDQSEVLLDRIDTIVIEVNGSIDVRDNTVKIIKGTPSSNAVRPELVNDDDVHQYPICDIFVGAEVDYITQADITNRVGTEDTPFVTGILDTISIDALIAQWETEWSIYIRKMLKDTTEWAEQEKEIFDNYRDGLMTEMEAWKTAEFSDFNTWLSNLQYVLSGDVAGNLQLEIEALDKESFERYYSMINKTTNINKNDDGVTTEIVETYSDALATTTFSTTDEGKKIAI